MRHCLLHSFGVSSLKDNIVKMKARGIKTSSGEDHPAMAYVGGASNKLRALVLHKVCNCNGRHGSTYSSTRRPAFPDRPTTIETCTFKNWNVENWSSSTCFGSPRERCFSSYSYSSFRHPMVFLMEPPIRNQYSKKEGCYASINTCRAAVGGELCCQDKRGNVFYEHLVAEVKSGSHYSR